MNQGFHVLFGVLEMVLFQIFLCEQRRHTLIYMDITRQYTIMSENEIPMYRYTLSMGQKRNLKVKCRRSQGKISFMEL